MFEGENSSQDGFNWLETANRDSTIALPQWPIDMIKQPQLEMADIYAVQGLIMGYLRRRARHTRHDISENKYLFAMLDRDYDNNNVKTIYDGSRDSYMVCKVQKVSRDQWRMVASFLTMTNTKATKEVNCRDLYRFDWLENGNRQAWYSSTFRHRTSEGLFMKVNDSHPISSDECIELQDRMLEFSQAVNPISSQSIMVPSIKKSASRLP